tara:strand:- start:746 stop:1330 length:585 start_codon:yes stop_codon:yes gene_type:complete
MRYFESTFTIRHVSPEWTNHYKIHQQVEAIIAGDTTGDKIKTPYVFDYDVSSGSKQAEIAVRTIQPTGLPGEQVLHLAAQVGDSVCFGLHYRPQMNMTECNKRNVYIRDKHKRIEKVIARLEAAGLDPQLVDEIEETYRRFQKRQHKFLLGGARYFVKAVITDPTLFEKAFTSGIGPKASFGFGKIVLLPGVPS